MGGQLIHGIDLYMGKYGISTYVIIVVVACWQQVNKQLERFRRVPGKKQTYDTVTVVKCSDR